MKNLILKLTLVYFILTTKIFASSPAVVCHGLPGCPEDNTTVSVTGKNFFGFLGNIITVGIQFVAVISVISLIIAGIMYLISAGEDEKVKKARKWITWAIVGVIISTTAWTIVNLANSLKIN
ncbi:MAG: hypothetical protein PHE25_03775 [Candidatus Gracilibacteria bacterium]|nr:hypothetical protein [Candidatus Gracilibacteria bacterium]